MKQSSLRLIKKYPNRRLYDTSLSAYITLTDVKQLVLDNHEFQVVDAKTNEDITRSILLQIIIEEESEGSPLFTPNVLSNIIRFYGNTMQNVLGSYLEKNVQAFIDMQSQLQEQGKNMLDNGKAFSNPELWTQFLNIQAPMMQNMMSNYVDQSKNLFTQMQEQMQQQARTMFSAFPSSFPFTTPPTNDKK